MKITVLSYFVYANKKIAFLKEETTNEEEGLMNELDFNDDKSGDKLMF